MERIFSGLFKQLMFDGDERGLTETLQGQNHPIGQQAVHQNPAEEPIIITKCSCSTLLFTLRNLRFLWELDMTFTKEIHTNIINFFISNKEN